MAEIAGGLIFVALYVLLAAFLALPIILFVLTVVDLPRRQRRRRIFRFGISDLLWFTAWAAISFALARAFGDPSALGIFIHSILWGGVLLFAFLFLRLVTMVLTDSRGVRLDEFRRRQQARQVDSTDTPHIGPPVDGNAPPARPSTLKPRRWWNRAWSNRYRQIRTLRVNLD